MPNTRRRYSSVPLETGYKARNSGEVTVTLSYLHPTTTPHTTTASSTAAATPTAAATAGENLFFYVKVWDAGSRCWWWLEGPKRRHLMPTYGTTAAPQPAYLTTTTATHH